MNNNFSQIQKIESVRKEHGFCFTYGFNCSKIADTIYCMRFDGLYAIAEYSHRTSFIKILAEIRPNGTLVWHAPKKGLSRREVEFHEDE